MAQDWVIRGGAVVTPEGIIDDGTVVVRKGRIAYVGPANELPATLTEPGGNEAFSTAELPEMDARGRIVAPGYVDVHVHGGGHADTMNGTVEAVARIAEVHAAHGTAVMLPTTMTTSREDIVAATKAVKEAMAASAADDWKGARIVGMHMEGPYIHRDMVGAQHPKHVRPADMDELQEVYAILDGGLRLITLAPEVEGNLAAVRWLRDRGVAVSIGHTAATYDEALNAIEQGVNHATHSYNAMTGLHHRNPGVVGALMSDDRVYAELIADGIHVHPAAMKVLFKAKGPERLCLITDAMEAMGMPDGVYELGGQPVIMKDGECRLESGSLAGSVLSMDRAVANMVKLVGVDLVDAVRMASLTPAESVGLADTRGSLTVGKYGDVTLLDSESLLCTATLVEGRLAYEASA